MTLPAPSPVSVTDDDVAMLLLAHHQQMRAATQEESCHVMDPDGLIEAGARLVGLREAGSLLGIGALVRIDDGHGELKSMHTARAARGRGVARAILRHLMRTAYQSGLYRLSLETGSDRMFEPARQLYRSEGFEICAPFGGYRPDPLSVFMTRRLRAWLLITPPRGYRCGRYWTGL